MTFSIGTTPAAASPAATAVEDLAEAPERDARDVAERGDDGVLGERAGLTGIGDRKVGSHRARV